MHWLGIEGPAFDGAGDGTIGAVDTDDGQPVVHRRLVAIVVAAALGAGAANVALDLGEGAYRDPGAAGFGLAALSVLALLTIPSSPLIAVAVTSGVVAINAMVGFDIGVVQWPPWIALFACFATCGARDRAVGAALAAAAVASYVGFDRGDVDLSIGVGIATSFLIAVVGGDALRARRAVAASERARLAAEAREQASAAERVLLSERARLARELHDALGHAVNVMVLQAGVGGRVFDDNADYARQALGTIETVGRDALGELDRMLAVLHPDRHEELELADPTIDDVAELVDRVRATGHDVELRLDGLTADGADRPLPARSARAVHRIVQEALTNAVRHGAGGAITVEIGRIDGEVTVVVRNAGGFATITPGRGLVNMRERARLEGGSLDAGPDEDGFTVVARLPLARVDA
ncbi:MAG: histidine kinase [Actinomycetota bacterium]|nr:histidine kinase [Actinomycetota bacterium]